MKKIIGLVAIAMCVFVFIGQAADIRYKVYVSVTCPEDANTKASIESYVKRELRGLHDVDIMTEREEAQYFLTIAAVKTNNVSGHHTGYAFSFCFYARASNFLTVSFLESTLGIDIPKDKEAIIELFGGADKYHPPALGVKTGGTNALKELSEDVVVTFDTDVLEPEREFRDAFR